MRPLIPFTALTALTPERYLSPADPEQATGDYGIRTDRTHPLP